MTKSTEEAAAKLGLNQAEEARTVPNNTGTAMPHDMTGAGVNVHIPRRDEEDSQRRAGAAFDVDAGDMLQDGVVAIDDSDDAILDEEKQHKISDIPGTAPKP